MPGTVSVAWFSVEGAASVPVDFADLSLFPPQEAIDKATATAGIIKSFFIRMIVCLSFIYFRHLRCPQRLGDGVITDFSFSESIL